MNPPCRIALLLGVLAAVGLSGCAYHLGAVGKPGYRSVAVPMFRNETVKPQLAPPVTNAIIKRLQTDGSLPVTWEADADIVVHGTITEFTRTVLRTQVDDTRAPREYRLRLTAKIEVRDRRTGKLVMPAATLTGQADAFLGSDLQTAEEQALPLIADDLARQVVSRLTERW